MKKVFKIKNNNLLIDNSIIEYDDIITKRLLSFDEIDEKSNIENHIIINQEFTNIIIKNKTIVINQKLIKTDIYTILNNVISNLINDDSNIFLHSSVISHNDKGILILGDFDTGKTTLCIDSQELGFEVNSADQTWLKKKNNDLYLELGSKYMVFNQEETILNNNNVNKKIKIEKILILKGICDKGIVNIKKLDNNIHKYKNISKYATWNAREMLVSDDVLLFLNFLHIKEFLLNINTDVYNVRGDSKAIIKVLKEELK